MKFKNNTIDNPVAFFEDYCDYKFEDHLASFYSGVREDHFSHITNAETHEACSQELDEVQGEFIPYTFSFDSITSKKLKSGVESSFRHIDSFIASNIHDSEKKYNYLNLIFKRINRLYSVNVELFLRIPKLDETLRGMFSKVNELYLAETDARFSLPDLQHSFLSP